MLRRRIAQPDRIEIQHRIDEAAAGTRFTIMGLARLHQDDAAGCAADQLAAAAELLQPPLRHADQHLIVKMWVIGMAVEGGTHGLGAADAVAGKTEPVPGICAGHAAAV